MRLIPIALCAMLAACSDRPVEGPKVIPAPVENPEVDGLATVVMHRLPHTTVAGERFDPYKLVISHPTAPMGSCLRVTVKATGKKAALPVNDRPKQSTVTAIEVTPAVGRMLGIADRGSTPVRLALVDCTSGQ